MVLLVASFFPFQTTYYLNGHSFIEQELNRAGISFRKHDNAFLASLPRMRRLSRAPKMTAILSALSRQEAEFFHKRLCGPLANSRFHHRPDPQHRRNSRLEAAYHRADTAVQRLVDLLAAA